MFRSLRSRLLLASLLWTAGLLLLMHIASMLLMHALPMMQKSKPTIPILAGLVLMAGGLAAASGTLVPFLRLREEVMAVQQGQAPRIAGAYPSEVQPLINSLNDLIADRERAIDRAQAVAGDLAHGLKTPLALLAKEADAARTAGNLALAQTIQEQVQRMANQVDYHLARARAAAAGPAGSSRCAVTPCVEALLRTLTKLHAERNLEIIPDLAQGLSVRVRQEDLEEILGNVLDNACKWAHKQVRFTVQAESLFACFTIEDDGPGLPEAQRNIVMQRGVRLDETTPGTGLGLAIARSLTENYAGTIALETSPHGGLCVRIRLPLPEPN